MKKLLVALSLLLLLPAMAFAVDLTGMSYDELVALKDQVQLAIWQSESWQEVTVPQGLWLGGADIPAGKWTLCPVDGSRAHITIGRALESNGQEIAYGGSDYYSESIYSPNSSIYRSGDRESLTIDVKDGLYVEIENASVIFTPYSGKPSLGFK